MFKKDHMELLENIHDYGVNLSTREIFLNSTHHTEEGEEGGVDFEMAHKFIKNIQLLQSISNETIIIHACSCGGDWNYGIAIYDAIANCNCKTILISHANARSMSSIIPQAATWRLIMPNCDFMIHYGTHNISGTSQVVKSSVDWNEHLSKVMLKIYAERCQHGLYFEKKSIEEIVNCLDEKMRYHIDWWLNAENAVNYGFMDAIAYNINPDYLKKQFPT